MNRIMLMLGAVFTAFGLGIALAPGASAAINFSNTQKTQNGQYSSVSWAFDTTKGSATRWATRVTTRVDSGPNFDCNSPGSVTWYVNGAQRGTRRNLVCSSGNPRAAGTTADMGAAPGVHCSNDSYVHVSTLNASGGRNVTRHDQPC